MASLEFGSVEETAYRLPEEPDESYPRVELEPPDGWGHDPNDVVSADGWEGESAHAEETQPEAPVAGSAGGGGGDDGGGKEPPVPAGEGGDFRDDNNGDLPPFLSPNTPYIVIIDPRKSDDLAELAERLGGRELEDPRLRFINPRDSESPMVIEPGEAPPSNLAKQTDRFVDRQIHQAFKDWLGLGATPADMENLRIFEKYTREALGLGQAVVGSAGEVIRSYHHLSDGSQEDEQAIMEAAEPAAAQPEQFSAEDLEIADRAWDAQMAAQRGLFYEFDQHPGQMVDFLGERYVSAHDHARDLDAFVERVQALGGLVHDMTALQDRPITSPDPLGAHPGTVTRTITADDVTAYNRFYSAVVNYTGALVNHSPNAPEVAEAAAKVAQLVAPDAWRAAGYDIPADVQPLARHNPRWYLEELVRLRHDQQ